MKMMLIPLDERPCNADYPRRLWEDDELELVMPKEMGDKKTPADTDKIADFITSEARNCQAAVISLDTVLYGGLIPSRLHHLSKETIIERIDVLRKIKELNPAIKLYVFQTVMRCPSYSSSDEEPDYYETYGETINRLGIAIHKQRLDEKCEDDIKSLNIPEDVLSDYTNRRRINREINMAALSLVDDGTIDFMIIPQDDSAEYGYAAMDRDAIRDKVRDLNLGGKVLMYPGADEVELTLMARAMSENMDKKPKVYVKYASEGAKYLYPIYEGKTLSSTIASHILAAGCQMTDSYEHADINLCIMAPPKNMKEADAQPVKTAEYMMERDLAGIVDFCKERHKEGKITAIVDNAYGNGGDLELVRMLDRENMLLDIDSYAGWNTSANTLGTTISEAVHAFLIGKTDRHVDFLVQRYIEDDIYMCLSRWDVDAEIEKGTKYNYFDVKERDGEVAKMVEESLKKNIKEILPSIADKINLYNVTMPWKRMFEVRFEAELKR